MYRFNIKVEPDIVRDLCLNENTVIEAFFDDGNIIVRVLGDEEAKAFDHMATQNCSTCCKARAISAAFKNMK